MLYTAQTRLSVATALFCGSGGKVESDPTFLEKSSLTLISGKSSLTLLSRREQRYGQAVQDRGQRQA